MKRITLTFDDDGELKKETHFVIGGNDYSICGHDLAGDSDLGYAEGKETHNSVNCPDCLCLVHACKKQRLKLKESRK